MESRLNEARFKIIVLSTRWEEARREFAESPNDKSVFELYDVGNYLSKAYEEVGEYRSCIAICDEVLSAIEGRKDLNDGYMNYKKAMMYQHLGELEKAREQAIIAISYCEKPIKMSLKIRFYSDLSAIFIDLVEMDQALNIAEKALDLCMQEYGEKHGETSVVQSFLGVAYHKAGHLDRAIQLMEAALQTDLELFGAQHSRIAIRKSNLATFYALSGKKEMALVYLEECLINDFAHFGPVHPKVALRYNNIGGFFLESMLDPVKAVDYLQTGLNIVLKTLGEKAPLTLSLYVNLTNAHLKADDMEKAREYFKVASSLAAEVLPANDKEKWNILKWLEQKVQETTKENEAQK